MRRAAWIFVFAISRVAFAGTPTPENIATARELYKQGAEALDAGNAQLAVEKLSTGWALAQTPVIGADLALAHTKLGHLVEAREAALAVMRLPVVSDETARSQQARLAAEQLAEKLAQRIPHMTVKIENLGDHTGTLKVDGGVVPLVAAAVARQVNPGAHLGIIDTDDGRHAEGTVTLAEGATAQMTLTLELPNVTDPPPAREMTPITTAPTIDKPAPHGGPSPLVWVGVATMGVGLAVGAISGAFALAEASTVKQDCTGLGRDGFTVCGRDHSGDLDAANTAGIVSTIGFVGAGVGVAVFITGLVLGGGSKKPTAVIPLLGPTFGVRGAF